MCDWPRAKPTPVKEIMATKLEFKPISLDLDLIYMHPDIYHAFRRAGLPRWYRRIWPWLCSLWR